MADEKNIVVKLNSLIADNYQNNPTMRLLLPVVAAMTGAATGDVMTGAIVAGTITSLAEAIDFSVSKIHQDRFNTLIGELEKQNIVLTEQVVQSEEFIHSVLVIIRASLNTYQREKIRQFARILSSAIENNELASDKFEEFVRILDDITIRELRIIFLLNQFENANPHKLFQQTDNNGNVVREQLENDLQRTNNFWDEFIHSSSNTLGFDENTISAILIGLTRTGMYETFSGALIDYKGGQGKTTTLFQEFSEWIEFEGNTDSILYPDN